MRLVLALLLVALVCVANAFTFSASADSAEISCSEGKTFVWIANDLSTVASVSFSAQTTQLNGFFDEPYLSVPAGQAKGTWFHFSSGNCFRGEEEVSLSARICSGDACSTKTIPLKVYVFPCTTCSQYVDGAPNVDYYEEAAPANVIKSGVEFQRLFYPTEYSVAIKGGEECATIVPGKLYRQKLLLINKGPAATFDLKLHDGAVLASLSHSYVSLQRGEAKNIFVDVKPVAGGIYYLTLDAMHSGVTVGQEELCFEAKDIYKAEIALPRAVEIRDCEADLLKITGSIRNLGTAADTYFFAGTISVLMPEPMLLKAGEEKPFEIVVNVSKLRAGENVLQIRGESDNAIGMGEMSVFVTRCEETSVGAQQQQNENVVTVAVKLRNDGDSELKNVSVEVQGIPSAWEVTAPSGITVAPHSEKEVEVVIKQTTDEEADPVLVAKSDGKEIGRIDLPKIVPPTPGITGLFVMTLTRNWLIILVVIIIAAIVLVLGARYRTGREEYLKRVEKLKSMPVE